MNALVPVSEHQAVGPLWDWRFSLWELDDRVGENPTFPVKSGLKLDFAGTFCRDIFDSRKILDLLWKFQKQSGPFPEPSGRKLGPIL
jgi:hypothetical protein